uniref:Uncharacterized protein n=1 Tax=Anguilla anguilla TaxID=7936 RepID=A0A0E9XG46_ANGAN
MLAKILSEHFTMALLLLGHKCFVFNCRSQWCSFESVLTSCKYV